jgi:hypothetical protein
MRSSRTKPKPPRGHETRKANPKALSQANVAEFERERMGIAPKE